MKREIARKVLTMSTGCSRVTNDSVRQVREESDEETFKIYRGHGGKIMGYLYTEVIAPIQSEHIDLAPLDFKPMLLVEQTKRRLTMKTRDKRRYIGQPKDRPC